MSGALCTAAADVQRRQFGRGHISDIFDSRPPRVCSASLFPFAPPCRALDKAASRVQYTADASNMHMDHKSASEPAKSGADRLSNRVAIVTGGGNGLGAAIADRLVDLGASVGIVDVDYDAAEAVSHQLGAGEPHFAVGHLTLPMRCDVSNPDEVAATFAAIAEALGPVDILVNNAGISSSTPFAELTLQEWNRVLAVNLTSVFVCSKAVTSPMMTRGSGAIINIASLSGKRGGSLMNRSAYAASKAGMIGLTKALAREFAPHGIRVNAIAPGQFDTRMSARLRTDIEIRDRILSTIPLGRFGAPGEVAGAVAFLASDDASYITGETINIDGGVMME